MNRQKYIGPILEWFQSVHPKPLLLWGARQVGKTTLMRGFAKTHCPDHVYLNFETDKKLASLFEDSLDPERILRNLGIYFDQKINSKKTLIIFDEIQECDNALNSLKYFAEAECSYRVIAAGSLLGVKHSKKGFPVGQVQFLDIHPMCFMEFLEMTEQDGLAGYIGQLNRPESIPSGIHHRLIEKTKEYMWLGGMPEVVGAYVAAPQDFAHIRNLQSQICRTYQLDFAKYAPASQVAKIGELFAQIPLQIAKENKKFKLSEIGKNARLREYGEALQWLIDAGMIHKVTHITQIDAPLAAHADQDVFKLFMLDTGLVGAMLNVPIKIILDQSDIFSSYKGALTESFVAQQLIANDVKQLYYWTNANSAEIDFVIQFDGEAYPLEVKSGINVRSKSLVQFGQKYKSNLLSRCTALNYRKDGDIVNYPLYCVSQFPKWTGHC